jgi:hypothetical protein
MLMYWLESGNEAVSQRELTGSMRMSGIYISIEDFYVPPYLYHSTTAGGSKGTGDTDCGHTLPPF